MKGEKGGKVNAISCLRHAMLHCKCSSSRNGECTYFCLVDLLPTVHAPHHALCAM